MRILILVLFFGLLWVSGWIVGSLYPAPQMLLTPVQSWLAEPEDAPDRQIDTDGTDLVEPTEFSESGEAAAPDADPPPSVNTSESEASPDQYRAWISEARAEHPYTDSEERMFAVMMCESGGDASIVNPAGPYTGLFQYAVGTWNGDWNLYRDNGMTDARSQIFATALAWNLGMQNQWGCYTSHE